MTSLSLQQVDYHEPSNFWIGPRAVSVSMLVPSVPLVPLVPVCVRKCVSRRVCQGACVKACVSGCVGV